MLEKLGKIGRTIVSLSFAIMSIMLIIIGLKTEASIGAKLLGIIICGGFLWFSVSELKDEWTKEE